MANEYAVNKDDLESVADAIRGKSGKSDKLSFPSGFVESVNSIEGADEGNAIIDGILQGTLSGEYYNDRVTEIRQYGFYKMNIKGVSFPNVTTIGNSAFSYCGSLTFVNVPLVQELNTQCFGNCELLTYIDLPKVAYISGSCFVRCTSLRTVILRTPSVCHLSYANAFEKTPIANGTGFIYVPDDLVEQYKVATNWATYANQIRGISELEG